MNNLTQNAFENQVLYCGIDVHKKSWKVCFRMSGLSLNVFSMDPDPKKLVEKVSRDYPGASYLAVYEAGFSGFWIQRTLAKQGMDCIVVHPADVPTTHKEKNSKSDRIDCRKLARELENGSLAPIFLPDEVQESFRVLIRHRPILVKEITRTKNRIKNFLYTNGISIPEKYHDGNWSNLFCQWLQQYQFPNPATQIAWDSLLRILLMYRQELKTILKATRELVKSNDELSALVQSLSSAPGIGFITATTFISEIMEMKRFDHQDQLACYVGLVPSVISSGEKSITKGITHRGNRRLRTILIEAAWIAARKDPTLTKKFGNCTYRSNKNKAIVAVAKRLLFRLRRLWIHHEMYRIAS